MLENYYNKMDRLSRDVEYCRMICDERIETNLRKAEAYDEGREEGKREIVRNMYNDKLSYETIAKYANISIDEVNKMINSFKSK